MPAKYQTVEKGNPGDPTAPKKHYARVVNRGVCNLDKLAKEAADRSALSRGDILSAFENMTELIAQHIAEGEIVQVGKLGSFYLGVKSEGAASAGEVTANNIKSRRLNFRSARELRQQLDQIVFEKAK